MPDYGNGNPMKKTWFDQIWQPFGSCSKPCCMLFHARLHLDRLSRWDASRILVAGKIDLFASVIPDNVIRDLFLVMSRYPRHRFRIVTRDAYRMEQWFGSHANREFQRTLAESNLPYPCENVDLGIIARTQLELDDQLGALVGTPAVRRFILFDRLCGPVDLTDIDCPGMTYEKSQVTSCTVCYGKEYICSNNRYNALVEDVHEVILGPVLYPDGDIWRRDLMDRCSDHNVPVIEYHHQPARERVQINV
jgi:hypothetical protein